LAAAGTEPADQRPSSTVVANSRPLRAPGARPRAARSSIGAELCAGPVGTSRARPPRCEVSDLV